MEGVQREIGDPASKAPIDVPDAGRLPTAATDFEGCVGLCVSSDNGGPCTMHSPSGRVGLSGPVRVHWKTDSLADEVTGDSPSPAASASDPPGGRVMEMLALWRGRRREGDGNAGSVVRPTVGGWWSCWLCCAAVTLCSRHVVQLTRGELTRFDPWRTSILASPSFRPMSERDRLPKVRIKRSVRSGLKR